MVRAASLRSRKIQPIKPSNAIRKPIHYKSLLLAVGIVLFGLVIWQTGWETILRSFTEVGFDYVWIILFPLSYYFFYSLGWWITVPPDENTIGLRDLIRARLVGEAINSLTPLGSFGGEPARALVIKGKMSMTVTTATLILDRTLYLFATVIFVLAGIMTAFFLLPMNAQIKLACVVTFAVFSGLLGFILFIQQTKAISNLAKFFSRWGKVGRLINRKMPQLEIMEQTVKDFYRRRPRAFLEAAFCHLVGRAGGTIEIWLMLYFLGAFSTHSIWHEQSAALSNMGLGMQLATSLLIAVFVIVLNFAFFMFPSQIGVAEGATAILFRSLHFNPALGVALQIVKRVKSLFYIALGLWLTARRKKLA